jgi:hypothetical protein
MSWAKLDDQFHSHPKARAAWKAHPRALGLHVLAMSYCAGHLTDGFVDDAFIEEKLPDKRERAQTVEALVRADLWAARPHGWQINDWLDYNPSKADVIAKRQADADRKQRGRDSQTKARLRDVSARNPSGVRAESSRPVPSRTNDNNL